MIIHLKKEISLEKATQLGQKIEAVVLEEEGIFKLVTSAKIKTLPAEVEAFTTAFFKMENDLQLGSRSYQPTTRAITISPQASRIPEQAQATEGFSIGGTTGHTLMIAGPCSVESEAQLTQAAELCVSLGIRALRAGAFKPRTSPYSFQGLGTEGLKLLDKMRQKYGLAIVTEVRDATHADEIIDYADVIQIGAKSMYDHGILRKCGKIKKPVLLKRGFGTTLQEFVQAAEFILSGGNPNLMLCERGIRTFETGTRFTLDLCGVAWLKEKTNLPVILDPSHAMGYAYGVPDLARACVAMGVDGLLIETHPTPASALSDASQQLDFKQFSALFKSLKPVAEAVGRKMI